MNIFSHRTLIGIILLALSGCQNNNATEILQTYANRMSNVLEVDINLAIKNHNSTLLLFPAKRDLTHPLEDIRQGVFEVWDFRLCEMLRIISERNIATGFIMNGDS